MGPVPCLSLVVAALAGLGLFCSGVLAAPAPAPGPSLRSVVSPLLLLEPEPAGAAAGNDQYLDTATLLELDQLFNAIHSKGKRGQQGPADKVLQPGGAGMWFGPRLGRRRRSISAQDEDPEGGSWRQTMEGKLAEIIKELRPPKRSCDPSELNCILYNIAASRPIAPESYQHSRSEGNLVNFTPRLGRESGEDLTGGVSRSRRFHMEDDNPLWFSPRLGRRSVSSVPRERLAEHASRSGAGTEELLKQ